MRTRSPAFLALAAASAACRAQCPLQPFEPSSLEGDAAWLTLFPTANAVPGVYVSGRFRLAGVETGLLRRTGGAWASVPGAPRSLGPTVQHTDSRGTALFGCPAPRDAAAFPLERYDGTSWEQFPGPAPRAGSLVWTPSSMASFDRDGPGPLPPALFLLVSFTYRDLDRFIDSGELFEWDGASWTSRGTEGAGMLTVFDADGPGPGLSTLYMTSVYTTRDSVGTESLGAIRRLNGAAIENVGTMAGAPLALAVYDPDGSGPQAPLLAIGGTFGQIYQGQTPTAAPHVALFNGATFSSPAGGLDGDVQSLAHFDPDGAGPIHPRLVAGGRFSTGLAAFDGTTWSSFAGGASGDTHILRAFDEDAAGPQPPSLFWSGRATLAGRAAGTVAVYRESWDGLSQGPSGPVNALGIFNQSIFAGGQFQRCGDTVVNNIARWDGSAWSALGGGLPPTAVVDTPRVYALAVHDDGSGSKLYIGGRFETAGTLPVSNIARWTGQAWEPVGFYGGSGGPPGPNRNVFALASFHGRLYAGGDFLSVSGGFAPNIASWTASGWANIPGSSSILGAVRALKVFDDGTGEALYVGGDQTPGGSSRLVWKLTDSGWVSLNGTTNPLYDGQRVEALEVFDAGAGPRLYAGGAMFPSLVRVLEGPVWNIPAGLTNANFVGAVHALRSVPHPGGNALLMGGSIYANSVQDPLATPPDADIRAISPLFDDGRGPAVFIAGDFQSYLENTPTPPGKVQPEPLRVPAPFLARYAPCTLCWANCDGSGDPPILNILDFNCFVTRYSVGDLYANCDHSTTPPVLNVLDFNCFLNRFTAGCP